MNLLQEKNKVVRGKKNNVFNTETMLPISEIRNTTIILKDGGLRAIIKVAGLNIDLRNYDEQVSVVEQYKKFLNGLGFPIQILVRNTYLELSDYINYIKEKVEVIDQKALKAQGEGYLSFMDSINAKTGLIYVKEFYIVVPYYTMEMDDENVRKPRWRKFLDAFSPTQTPEKLVANYRNFIKNDKFLETRINLILEGLKGIGIYGSRLGLTDMIGLLFKCYNPEAHKNMAEMVE
jgi:type IV secretory pathway VirB4 component